MLNSNVEKKRIYYKKKIVNQLSSTMMVDAITYCRQSIRMKIYFTKILVNILIKISINQFIK